MQEYVDISKILDAAMGEIGQILSDGNMASTSNRTALEDSPAISCGHFGPICSPFCCLSRANHGF